MLCRRASGRTDGFRSVGVTVRIDNSVRKRQRRGNDARTADAEQLAAIFSLQLIYWKSDPSQKGGHASGCRRRYVWRRHVADAYSHCKAVLTANRPIFEELTEMLIEEETIDYKQLESLVKKYYPDGLGTEKIPLPASAKVM